MNNPNVDFSIPGSIWYDALDPMVTGMQEELGLPEPTSRAVGRGITVTYTRVPANVAEELASYLVSRGAALARNAPDNEGLAGRLIKSGDRITAIVDAARRKYGGT